jgi:hypothetical protein
LVDALPSGGSVRKDVLVRIQSRALNRIGSQKREPIFFSIAQGIACTAYQRKHFIYSFGLIRIILKKLFFSGHTEPMSCCFAFKSAPAKYFGRFSTISSDEVMYSGRLKSNKDKSLFLLFELTTKNQIDIRLPEISQRCKQPKFQCPAPLAAIPMLVAAHFRSTHILHHFRTNFYKHFSGKKFQERSRKFVAETCYNRWLFARVFK